MHTNILTCVGGGGSDESGLFRIDSGVKQGYLRIIGFPVRILMR